jgi:hypothetical protein
VGLDPLKTLRSSRELSSSRETLINSARRAIPKRDGPLGLPLTLAGGPPTFAGDQS